MTQLAKSDIAAPVITEPVLVAPVLTNNRFSAAINAVIHHTSQLGRTELHLLANNEVSNLGHIKRIMGAEGFGAYRRRMNESLNITRLDYDEIKAEERLIDVARSTINLKRQRNTWVAREVMAHTMYHHLLTVLGHTMTALILGGRADGPAITFDEFVLYTHVWRTTFGNAFTQPCRRIDDIEKIKIPLENGHITHDIVGTRDIATLTPAGFSLEDFWNTK